MATESISISEETSDMVNEASKVLGIEKNEFVDRAILLYLDNLEKFLDLKKELKAWDRLSDEALNNLEKSI